MYSNEFKIIIVLIAILTIYTIYKNKSLEKMTDDTSLSQVHLTAIKNLGNVAASMISGNKLTLPYDVDITGNLVTTKSISHPDRHRTLINNDRTWHDPSVYRTRGMGIYTEFKNHGGWGVCQTFVPWVDTTGGSIFQIFYKNGIPIKRTANETSNTWNDWKTFVDDQTIRPDTVISNNIKDTSDNSVVYKNYHLEIKYYSSGNNNYGRLELHQAVNRVHSGNDYEGNRFVIY